MGKRSESPIEVAVAPEQPSNQPDANVRASNALERKVFAASSFDAEMFDGKWSREAEVSISNKLESIRQAEVAVTKVECRTTLCRFNVSGRSDVGTQTFLRSMIRSNIGAGMAVPADENAPEDNSRVTVYVVREGYSLPEPPSAPDLQETGEWGNGAP
jgi:2-keto-3-deoxy-L-rhamnonate aldolase RhmA